MDTFTNVLPADFTGVFHFTNPSDEDFVGKWANKAYMYPALKTTPMVIMDATPLEIQNIRKKFAKELAEREFFKSERAKQMTSIERANNAPALNSIHQANVYSDSDLKEYIQKCLEPLPLAQQTITEIPRKNTEDTLSRDEDGELNTQPVTRQSGLTLKDKNKRGA